MDRTLVDILHNGLVQGVADERKNVIKFLNIPYATVLKRWRKASPVESWQGIRDATRPGPMCPQVMVGGNHPESIIPVMVGAPTDPGPELTYSERDCLNLAIYVPNIPASEPVRTLVYCHGGRYRNGGNAHPVLDFTNFVSTSVSMNKPVIVVALNYRLGHFGFLGSRELALEFGLDPEHVHTTTHDQDEAYGNWGLHDQKLAFKWIREHIHIFGGRGTDLTAMGPSGGGSSLLYHMMIPAHHGLFTRAIIMSGSTEGLETSSTEMYGQRMVDRFCKHFGVKTGLDNSQHDQRDLAIVQALRAIPADKLIQVPDLPRNGSRSFPTLDNQALFPCHSARMIQDPSLFDRGIKSVIFGLTTNEAVRLVRIVGAPKLAQWQPMLDQWFDPLLHEQVREIYGTPTTDAESRALSGVILRDLGFWNPIRDTLGSLQKQSGCKVYRYYFEASNAEVEKRGLDFGAYHCVDMTHPIMSDLTQTFMTQEERAVGWAMVRKWIDFVWDQDSFLPESREDAEEMSALSANRKSDQVALRITQDLGFETCPYERLEQTKWQLFDRNVGWTMQKLRLTPEGRLLPSLPSEQCPQTSCDAKNAQETRAKL
ncbi:hypothetical protein BGZ52_006353 [Haplosporangium bisporale]|nr:hypothetical protein BGZ52_006353 [Haplosporangium bisporale]